MARHLSGLKNESGRTLVHLCREPVQEKTVKDLASRLTPADIRPNGAMAGPTLQRPLHRETGDKRLVLGYWGVTLMHETLYNEADALLILGVDMQAL